MNQLSEKAKSHLSPEAFENLQVWLGKKEFVHFQGEIKAFIH